MIRLINVHNDEVFPGHMFGPFKILAIDYPNKRILFSHHGAIKEFPDQHRYRFVE